MNWGPLREYEITDEEAALLEYKAMDDKDEPEDDSEDEWEEVIIGKEGEYQMGDDGTIYIPKKPKGAGGPPPPSKSGGDGEEGEGEEDEKEGKGKGKGKGQESKDKKKGEGEGEGENEGDGSSEEDYSEIPEGTGVNEINEHNKRVSDRVAKGEDLTNSEAKKKIDAEKKEHEDKQKGGGGGRGNSKGNNKEVDWANKRPTYTWDKLIKLFIGRPKEFTEPSYAKIGRGSITGLHTARQIGAGAAKPGDLINESKQMDLCFVVDASGSMSGMVATIFSNIAALLGTPKFKKNIFTLIKFSNDFQIWKGNLALDKAGQLSSDDILKKAPIYTDSMKQVFTAHDMGSTNFGPALATDLSKLIMAKYNIIVFTDSDCSGGANGDELAALIKKAQNKVFVIFDHKDTWVSFRQKYKLMSDNISYFNGD